MPVFSSDSMTSTGNLLSLLGIAIALSAYLSAIRAVAIQKIHEIPEDHATPKSEKWRLTKKLFWLTLADIPMVFSAFLLGLSLLWNVLRLGQICEADFWKKGEYSLVSFGLWFFLIAGTVMLLMHMFAWGKSFKEICKGNEKTERAKRADEKRARKTAKAAEKAAKKTEVVNNVVTPDREAPAEDAGEGEEQA